jgi:hypothetical protein
MEHWEESDKMRAATLRLTDSARTWLAIRLPALREPVRLNRNSQAKTALKC